MRACFFRLQPMLHPVRTVSNKCSAQANVSCNSASKSSAPASSNAPNAPIVIDKHYVLFYDYVADAEEKRKPLRTAHLNYIRPFAQARKVILGGAWGDLTGAAIVFKCDSKEEVTQFVKNDPYVTGGLVTQWTTKEWNVVIKADKQE